MELRVKATSLFGVRQLPGSELKHVFPLLTVGPVHTFPYSLENATFSLRFKRNARPHAAFSHRFTYTMNRYKNDNFETIIRLRMLDACAFAIMCLMSKLKLIL